MKKLNDLEICKRIAEIEGLTVIQGDRENKNCIYHNWQTSERYGIILHGKYNPLTDDALCFRLMIKYNVMFTPEFNGKYSADEIKSYTFEEEPVLNNPITEGNPNKAICLAIIEANNETNRK